MVAHNHGQTINYSKLAASLGVSSPTVKLYVDILSETYMLRLLPPLEVNIKKRLIKSPKVYIRDSGIFHSLMDIENFDDLFSHPGYGASWEGFCIENIISSISDRWNASFYRTSSGKELDLILEKGQKRIAIEFKASRSPTVTKGFWSSLSDLNIKKAFIVAPVDELYPITKDVYVSDLNSVINEINRM